MSASIYFIHKHMDAHIFLKSVITIRNVFQINIKTCPDEAVKKIGPLILEDLKIELGNQCCPSFYFSFPRTEP